MTATVRVPWRNGFVDAGNPDPIATASFSFTERTAHRAGGGCDRVLIGRILNRRLHVTIPPPVSVQMARDIGGYQSGLTLFHLDLIEPWVAWFADAIAAPATRTTEVLDDVAVVQDGWRIRTAYLNIDAGVRHLCELLLRAPFSRPSSLPPCSVSLNRLRA